MLMGEFHQMINQFVNTGGVLPIDVYHDQAQLGQVHDIHARAPLPPAAITAPASAAEILQTLIAVVAYHAANPHGNFQAPLTGQSFTYNLGDNEGGGTYSDWNDDFGWFDRSGGVDFEGSNHMSDGPAVASTDAAATNHIPGAVQKADGSEATVSFGSATQDHKPSDNAVTPQLVDATRAIIANAEGITSVNISATTNGVHSENSDHYSGNAVDINSVNGNAVQSEQGRLDALRLEAQALADTHTRYVEGPGGNWARTTEGGQWVRSRDLPTSYNHVHWSTFRNEGNSDEVIQSR